MVVRRISNRISLPLFQEQIQCQSDLKTGGKRLSSFGSSYGSVGGAVASDAVVQIVTLAKFYLPIVHLNRRDEKKKKRPGKTHL